MYSIVAALKSGNICNSAHCDTICDPAKAVGWNEMPFHRDTFVVPSNIVLERDHHSLPAGRGDCNPFWT